MQLTTNTRAMIEAEQYSSFILMTLNDGLLGEAYYRNVSEFKQGDTFNIKTIGKVTLQEASENEDLIYNPIETGTITLSISEYVGDAWYISDDLREDGTSIPALEAARGAESTRAFQEYHETRFLAQCNSAQINANPMTINGQPHRIASTASNNKFTLAGMNQLKLSFDKANVPAESRVFLCDPTVETSLNELVNITSDMTGFAQTVIAQGMARGQRLITTLYGFSVIMSNRLATGSLDDGTTTVAAGVANVAMCLSDDNTKPIMYASRRLPSVEGERNKDKRRDEFVTTSRFGFGVQRLDSLAIYITGTGIQAAF